MKVYTRIDGKLACFEVDTDDWVNAQIEVNLELAKRTYVWPATPSLVLAVIDGGKA